MRRYMNLNDCAKTEMFYIYACAIFALCKQQNTGVALIDSWDGRYEKGKWQRFI